MKTIKKEWNSLKTLEDKDIILVAGMPGSGKSTLVKNYYKNTHHIFDNFLKIGDYFEQLTLLRNTTKRKCILTEITLCDMSFFDHMVTKIKDAFPDAKIGAIFYENNPHNCITNVTHRSLNRGDKFVVSKPEQMVLVGKLDTTLPHVARPAYTVEIQKILDMYSKYTPSEYTSIPSSDSLIIPVHAA